MPFDDMSEQTHEFPAGPTNNFDTYYPDGYEDDEFDYDDEREYDFEDYDEDDYFEYDSTLRERIGWRLSSFWYKVRHPILELRVIRRTLRRRFFAKCQVEGCGKRGTVDGMLCAEHFIPF